MKYLAICLLGAMMCVGLSSCDDNSQLTSSGDPSYGAKPGSGTPADPAILYQLSHVVKGKSRPALHVCNADGTNQTMVVLASSALHKFWGQPTWSGDASAISYIEADTGREESKLKTTTISVVNGKPTAGTTTTLLTVTKASDHKSMAGGIWSPSANEIAYSLQASDGTWDTRQSEIRVIPSNGGASELIYTSPQGTSVYHMAWNSDGSKLAVVEWKFTSGSPLAWENWIKVIDRSTGTVSQTIDANALGMTSCTFIAWSRAGSNTLAVTSVNGNTPSVHTIDMDAPTGATEIQPYAMYPAWSPDNSKLLYFQYYVGMVAETVSSGSQATIVASGVSLPYWKK